MRDHAFCYCFDAQAQIPFLVSIVSLLENEVEPLTVYCFTRGVTKLPRFNKGRASVIHVDISSLRCNSFIDSYISTSGTTSSTFDRLHLPNLLPPQIKSCLYLDVDTVILSAPSRFLASVYTSPMGLAYRRSATSWRSMRQAVTDFHCPEMLRRMEQRDWMHGNVGVLLMDLVKLRRNGFTARCIDLAAEFRTNDQLAINYFCQGHFSPLPSEMNIFANRECVADFKMPGILHFAGSQKPWKPKPQCTRCKDVWNKYNDKRISLIYETQ